MFNAEAAQDINSGIPGSYEFQLCQYEQSGSFLSEFRRYEGICQAKGYIFKPCLSQTDDPPFDAFVITIPAAGHALPFVAVSRREISRKLTRM